MTTIETIYGIVFVVLWMAKGTHRMDERTVTC